MIVRISIGCVHTERAETMINPRMRRILTLVGLIPATLFLSADSVASVIDLAEKIDEIVQAEVGFGLFSGTVVVARDGTVLYAEAVGEANKEHNVPNTLETRFNISSVRKSFIATVIMRLAQEDRLGLDDPLSKYFPDCPYPSADSIRISHLLNHSSGLGDYRNNEEFQSRAEHLQNIEEVLPFVYAIEPTFAPGEGFQYSNAGALFLEAIIERVTENRVAEVVDERIFQPLGMNHTSYHVGGQLLPGRATGYRKVPGEENYLRDLGEPAAYTGGGVYTTGMDLLKFDQALYGNRLLDEEHKRIMFTPVGPNPSIAYGWFVIPFGGTTVVMHSGSSGGFTAEFRRYPEKGFTLIVNSNYQGAGFELTNAIEALLLGLPYDIASETTLRYREGMELQQAERYKDAAMLFTQNIQGEDPHLPSLYQAARTRLLGEYEQEKALRLLDRYISLGNENSEPSLAAAWWRKGVACEQLGDPDRAIVCYRRSLEIDPAFSYALEALEQLEENR
jgi:CubicO group peptidase (beta-lactamase class C family)